MLAFLDSFGRISVIFSHMKKNTHQINSVKSLFCDARDPTEVI